MDTNSLITVIIPCYNAEKFVGKAIKSIIEQTYINLEIIIVDDASNDNSLEIIKQFHDKRITVLELKENTRKIGAVEKAIQNANGDYIAFQDADDWSHHQRIERQVKKLAHSKHGVCFTDFDIYYEHGNLIKESKKLRDTDKLIRKEIFNYLNDVNSKNYKATLCTTMLVKADILKHIKGYHHYFAGRVAEDVHMVYNILKKTSACASNEKLYVCIRTKNSFTEQQFSGKNAKYAYSWQLLAKIIAYDQKGIDLLNDSTKYELLKKVELEACEEALVHCMQTKHQIEQAYKTSAAYNLGKKLLKPVYWLKEKMV